MTIAQHWIIVMGVSGSGKTTLGRALAEKLSLPFLEGDAFHPPANVSKMASGVPLSDEDRWPWLDALAEALNKANDGAVLACSALRRTYRDRLREKSGRGLAFIWLNVSRPALNARMRERKGHYMPLSLLDSQLATLEPPTPDEPDVATMDGEARAEALLEAALAALPALA